MLTSLSLRNFKCFESVEIPLGRITVLIGPNGSGKSSFLQALALLRQSLGKEQLEYRGQIVDLSSFQEIVFERDLSRSITISFGASTTLRFGPLNYIYSVKADEAVIEMDYSWDYWGETRDSHWTKGGQTDETHTMWGGQVKLRLMSEVGRSVMVRSIGDLSRGITGEDVRGIYGIPHRDIRSWRYTPTSRGFMRGSYDLSEGVIEEIRGDLDRDQLGVFLASTLAYDEDVREQISEWLGAITAVAIDSRTIPGRRTLVRSRKPGARYSYPIANEGFGSNQLTHMLFQLARTPRGGLYLLNLAR